MVQELHEVGSFLPGQNVLLASTLSTTPRLAKSFLRPLLPRVRWKICSGSPTDYLKIIIFTFRSARLFTPTHRHLRTFNQQRMKSGPFIKNHLTFTCGIFPSFHVPPPISGSLCFLWGLALHFCWCARTNETQSIILFITQAQYIVGSIFVSIQSTYKY